MEREKSYKASIFESAIFSLICLILFFAPIAYGAVDSWALGIIAILIFLICLLWILQAWKTKEFIFNDSPLQLPILGLVLIGLIQLLPLSSNNLSEAISVPATNSLSLDPHATKLAVVLLMIYLLFFSSMLTFVRDEKRVRKLSIFVITFGALFAFMGILQQLTDRETIFGLRIVKDAIPLGTFVNRHHFAAFMVMLNGLALGLIYNWTATKDKKLLLWIAVVLMSIALAMTGSRGAWLSFVGSAIFLLTISSVIQKNTIPKTHTAGGESISKKTKLVIGLLIFLFVVFATTIFLGKDEFLARGIGLTSQEDISSGRFHFWSVALQIFKDYPILGTGLDSYATVFSQYDTWSGKFRIERAHNDYLQILADAGLIGFLCILAFIYLLFKQGFQSIKNLSPLYQSKSADDFLLALKIGALMGCIGIMIHSFFDFPLRTNSNSFYFLLLSALAVNSFQREAPEVKSRAGIDSAEAQ